MRSGSPAHDGRGWSPAQHPYQDRGGAAAQAYGGPQPEREDVPSGPDASWSSGFRQAEFDSGEYRLLVESSYAADGRYPQESGYPHVDPRYAGGPVPGYQQQPGPGYQQAQPAQPSSAYQRPAEDYDYGYGDPGYADPSYDGPRGNGGYQGYQSAPVPSPSPAYQPPAYQPPAYPPAAPSGYQQPWPGAGPDADQIYPVTGAQEVYREEPRYEDQRHQEQRYEDQRYEEQRPVADPRLVGLRYDELRYDDGDSGGRDYDDSRYDEPLDDEAWYEELRRGGPAFQQHPSGPAGPAVPPGPGPGPSLSPSAGPAARPAQGGPIGPIGPEGPAGFQHPGYDRGNGGSGQYGGYGPRMSAVPAPGPGSGPMVGPAQPQAFGGFQAAPTFAQPSSVGVLTPPAGGRYQTRADSPQAFAPSAPPVGLAGAPPVGPAVPTGQPRLGAAASPSSLSSPARPAQMTGPDTAAWDVEAEAEEDEQLDVLEQYWQEDGDDGGYSALLDDLGEDDDHGRVGAWPRRDTGSQPAVSSKRIGRRRGGSSDHRLWLGLVGVAVVAGAAIFGIVRFEFPSNSGPSHELVVPASVDSYQWAPKIEAESGLTSLAAKFRSMLGSQATNVVSRVYESGSTTTGSQPQVVMFMGAHLPNQSPASSIANFTQEFKNAQVVNAGPMGGEAACTEASIGTADQTALCAWFDDDSVGVLTSATLPAAKLAPVMLQFRPHVELTKK